MLATLDRSVSSGFGAHSLLGSLAVLVKELRVHDNVFLDALSHLNAKAVLTQKVTQSVAVNQLNGRRAVPNCLSLGVTCEGPGRNEETFFATPRHGASEVPHCARSDDTLVALALEVDRKRDEGDSVGSDTVDPAITTLPGDSHVDEACLTQKALCQLLEPVGRQLEQACNESVLP